jgi:DNA-3-methyladenine glycosylase I
VSGELLYIEYHDKEWGIPCYDSKRLFEFLLLEGLQAGLSWITVLKKREVYREVLDGFNPERIAVYDETKLRQLMEDTRLIRNRRKMEGLVKNARAFLAVEREYGSFSTYIWRFVGGNPLQNCRREAAEVPTQTVQSQQMSKELKKKGFAFVGPTICYAFMQAVGMVNDHERECFRYCSEEDRGLGKDVNL